MPRTRKRQLHERIKTRMEGKDPDAETKAAEKEKAGAKKLGGTPEEVVAALSPEQREALYEVLVDYSYREFEDEVAAEESEEV